VTTAANQPGSAEITEESLQFSGPISSESIPALIHSILATRDTGVLTLRHGGLEKSAYIREGQMVFARSNDPENRLGEVLLRRGVLSVPGFEGCTDEVARTKRRLGGLLVDNGLITAEQLIEGVRDQVREIIHSMFQWTQGQYSFDMGPLPTTEAITLKMSTYETIRTGIQGVRTWFRIREAVGGLDTRYETAPDHDEKLDTFLTEEEENLLEFCSPPAASVREICEALRGNHFHLCRLIWSLSVVSALTRVR